MTEHQPDPAALSAMIRSLTERAGYVDPTKFWRDRLQGMISNSAWGRLMSPTDPYRSKRATLDLIVAQLPATAAERDRLYRLAGMAPSQDVELRLIALEQAVAELTQLVAADLARDDEEPQ